MDTSHGLAQVVEPLATDLRAIFGARLRSLVVYAPGGAGAPEPVGAGGGTEFDPGPLVHTLALVDEVRFDDLAACARRFPDWSRRQLAAPLILAADEFERSLDAFPVEYGEIIARHVVVHGESPFTGVAVDRADLRRACEVQAKSHLVHLREAFMEAGGQPAAVADLVAASARPFEALLANVARLEGVTVRSRADLARHAAERLAVEAAVVERIISVLHPGDLAPADATRLFPSYLQAVQRLAAYVDRWTE